MSDNLVFGNPTIDIAPLLKKSTYLDSLTNEINSYTPPANNSTEAQQELQALVEYVNTLSQNPALIARYDIYDKGLSTLFAEKLDKVGISDTFSNIKNIEDDITTILIKTKFHFQRIRPYQLAYYYNVPLYPFPSLTANTPSYPSGHAFQATVIGNVLGNNYPNFFRPIMELVDDICNSRMYMGLHYESDIKFGKYMAELVVNHPEFKEKYKL
jgi:hypothetical protein